MLRWHSQIKKIYMAQHWLQNANVSFPLWLRITAWGKVAFQASRLHFPPKGKGSILFAFSLSCAVISSTYRRTKKKFPLPQRPNKMTLCFLFFFKLLSVMLWFKSLGWPIIAGSLLKKCFGDRKWYFLIIPQFKTKCKMRVFKKKFLKQSTKWVIIILP